MDAATRLTMALLSCCVDWRSALMVVRPETLIGWHRAGFRLLWRWKLRVGRPPIPKELRELIQRMVEENPVWGQQRIANELLLKLGLRVSPRTVAKYLPRPAPGRPGGAQRRSTFLRNHAQGVIACDFLVPVTSTFRVLYVLVVIEHHSRRLIHFNVTEHPTTQWTWQQLREGVGYEERYKYVLHDRDAIFSVEFDESNTAVGAAGVEESAAQSQGKFHLRARDWDDSQRMFGLAHSALRSASMVDAESLGDALQLRTSALSARPRRS
ncbi:MAG: helix-turn-helix domain-containing protein [Pseudomonadota bacterium]|nr:helix-turn-helix domain-containing protein [Pseudomonadota bacterium]